MTVIGAGSVTVRASQAGDDNYNAAAPVEQAFTVAKADQTINFGALAARTYGDPQFSVSATASSGLGVSFSIVTGPATISGSMVTVIGAGSVTVRASQGGDDNYNAATPVEQAFTVAKADQTITFGALDARTFGDPPFSISATASSGLPVSFSVVSGSATISSNTVTITGAGSVTIRASQDGDDNYNAATPVERQFTVGKAAQSISFEQPPNMTFGDPDFTINPTASSGLPVSVTALGHCTVNGLTVHLTGAGSCTLTASQNGDANYSPAASVTRHVFIGDAGENQFVLTSFGAVGDGVTDDGPALQQALNALANAGGGTLFVPPGRYAITTPVTRTFNGLTSVSIRGVESDVVVSTTGGGQELAQGLNLVSEFIPKTGTNSAIVLTGLRDLLVADIGFTGTPGVYNDAVAVLYFFEIQQATIRHSEFYGLSTNAGAIVFASRSALRLEQTKFLGSFGNSGTYTSNVLNLEWKSIVLNNVVFLDYGLRPNFYGKGGFGATLSWVQIGNAAPVTPTSPRREAVFRNVFSDEGAFVGGISAMPGRYTPPSAPIDLVYITGLRMNVPNFQTTGHYFQGLRDVLITDSRYMWSHNADSAMEFLGASTVILEDLECVDHADRIKADAATQKLTVINSTYGELASQAQVTKVLTTQNPDDDPVQYVRQEFVTSLGRDPDAAAHFYWSNKLLNCGEDAQCVIGGKQALGTYLSAGPSPNFSIQGHITNEQGFALGNVTVTLTGSQSVTASNRYEWTLFV